VKSAKCQMIIDCLPLCIFKVLLFNNLVRL